MRSTLSAFACGGIGEGSRVDEFGVPFESAKCPGFPFVDLPFTDFHISSQ